MYYTVDSTRYRFASYCLLAFFIAYIMPLYLYACPFYRLASKYPYTIKECGIVKDLLLTYGSFILALHLYYYILLEEPALYYANIRR